MWWESGECARSGAVAALRGRELRRVHPQVLARYGGLGLASLPEHVLALGQPHDVLSTGAHSMVTGDLWNEKVRPRVLLGFAEMVYKQS